MPIQKYLDEFFVTTQSDEGISAHHDFLKSQLRRLYHEKKHGRQSEWDTLIKQLPNSDDCQADINKAAITLSDLKKPDLKKSGLENSTLKIEEILKEFKPWRKGPFDFFGTYIDTEWHSDWKWDRIMPHISNLQDRKVLDIGCGNGYHLWRMLSAGASLAVGIDPTRLFLYQFHITKHFIQNQAAYLLPLRGEDLPKFNSFDTVFSLGVLYHRRSPIDHLTELLGFLRPGGELVLETLIVEGDKHTVLTPEDRYAKMANVWFLPSTETLELWLARAGFRNIRTVDINQTSVNEQRATKWMDFHSLSDFLDPENDNFTAEGLPAPTRAILIAEKPS